jgi:long-chain acyl-CoA synthetase
MNIAQHVEQGRHLFPDRLALIFEDETFTYQQLDELSGRIARGLADLTIGRGDRIALLLPNLPAFVTSYLAILKRGAIAVAINPALKAEEVTFILKDSGARLVITTATLRSQVCETELPQLLQILIAEGECTNARPLSDLTRPDSAEADLVGIVAAEMQADDPAAILYTSGTTGFPKGAVLSHGNVLSNGRACIESFGLQPSDQVLLSLPIFHCFGQNAAMNPCFAAGATLVLQRQFVVDAVLQALSGQAITIFFGVPTLYLLLYEQATPAQLRSVRRCISAAATLPIALAHKWQAKYSLVINEGYGLTETCLNTFNHRVRYQPGSVGSPQADIALRIVANDGLDVPLGELGEVVVQGPNVMLGYWNRPEETAQVLRNGWFHTGDIGRVEADGYFYIVDRVKDMVNVGGTKVYPSEVEQVLYRHPAVHEAAVYGIAEATLGEQVCASIVLTEGKIATQEELIGFCRLYLADFKLPSLIEFVEQMPKGRTGKILKRILRDQMQANPIPISAPFTDNALHDRTISASKALNGADSPLLAYVQQELADLLGIEPNQVDRHHAFVGLGLNSLRAVALHNRLQRRLGVDVPVFKLLGDFALEGLITYINEQATSSTADAPLQPVDPLLSISQTRQAPVQEQTARSLVQQRRVQVTL